ncbi:MAG: DUF3619 family protein [Burkholderiales bacterium]|nr:DUF3619 family protein [Burkholderiales bacterium]
MSEEQFGRRVAWHLDRGLDQLDQGTLTALAAARQAALSGRSAYQQSSVPAMAAAGRGTVSSAQRRTRVRWWVPASAVALAAAALVYVQTLNNQHSMLTPNHELGTLDARLLADDLPIDAYLDKGFDAWLEDTSE